MTLLQLQARHSPWKNAPTLLRALQCVSCPPSQVASSSEKKKLGYTPIVEKDQRDFQRARPKRSKPLVKLGELWGATLYSQTGEQKSKLAASLTRNRRCGKCCKSLYYPPGDLRICYMAHKVLRTFASSDIFIRNFMAPCEQIRNNLTSSLLDGKTLYYKWNSCT